MGVVRALRERGWAQALLQWRWEGATLLTAEIAAARYFVRGDPHEAVAWAELRDVGGARRVEVGSFPSVGEARAACDRHAATLCVRERPPEPVDVRIAPPRESSRKPAKPVRVRDQANFVDNKIDINEVRAPSGRRRRPWGTSDACLQRRARREPSDLADLDAALAAFAHVLGEE